MVKLKTIMKAVATGSFTLLLAACYGVAYEEETKSGRVTVTDGDSNPITGLKLTLTKNSATEIELGYTDSIGMAEWAMDPYSEYTLNIEDVDGEKNLGEFAAKELDIEMPEGPGYDVTVAMEEITE